MMAKINQEATCRKHKTYEYPTHMNINHLTKEMLGQVQEAWKELYVSPRQLSWYSNPQKDKRPFPTHPALYTLDTQGFFLGVEQLGKLITIKCQGKKWWSYSCAPHTFSWHGA
jgi:hypothetical protein